ncbi:MAG: STY4526/YPO1902 family pathogenicity island replication protein [Burkholderiales bacterium]|nr:STY4526/YPO1902 family pathogenicity island replication protein [Burkholderiales bacterium]
MMLALQDGPLRFMVLTHLVSRLRQGAADEFLKAGVKPDQINRLRTLEASDIKRLAALPHTMIGLALDGEAVNSGLRHLAAIKDLHGLEEYFIRHGASPRMMKTLFTMSFKTTRTRRQALGQKGINGRPVLPTMDVRDRIHRFWAAHTQLDPRSRYYQLHQAFPAWPFNTLHSVIIEYERNKQ